MNLLYCMTAYPPSTGGAQVHLHEIARHMLSRHRVQVFCHWKENRTDWLRGVTVHAPGSSTYTQDGVPVAQINLDDRQRWSLRPWVWAYYLTMEHSVQEISDALMGAMEKQAGAIDLIHAGRIGREFIAWAALKLARKRGVPFVLTPFHHPRWKGWRYRSYLSLYQQADALMALTEAEKDMLAGLGVRRKKIHVIGHAPVLPKTVPQPGYFGPGGPVVLFLGQKYEYKGLRQLVDSMPLVWKSDPAVRFAFIGPRTHYSRKLFKSIRDPRVIEKDRVSEQEKINALADCTLVCMPSGQESFGGVYVEAWMFEKPVIGRKIPAVAELISAGVDGELVDEKSGTLSTVLLNWVQDPDQCRRLGKAGRQKVDQQFNWEHIAKRQENVYDDLLNRAKRGR